MLAGTATVTLSGSGVPEASSSITDGGQVGVSVAPALQDEIEGLRSDAVDDAARGDDRTSEPDGSRGTKTPDPQKSPDRSKPTENATPAEEPSAPADEDSDDEAADDDGAGGSGGDDAARGESAERQDAGFPPVPGCEASVPAEGSVANGQLGDEHLCDIGNGLLLRPDAAAAFLAMAEEYESDQGDSLLSCVGNTYRSYDEQVDLYQQKPGLAAEPGTSEHGWGLAIDFECGANSYDSEFHAWLTATGADFGWVNPPWAQPSGSRPEPWHWEFTPGTS